MAGCTSKQTGGQLNGRASWATTRFIHSYQRRDKILYGGIFHDFDMHHNIVIRMKKYSDSDIKIQECDKAILIDLYN